MTSDEWDEIVGVVSDRWPHSDVDERTADRWGADLADLDAGHVMIAVETLSRDGARFAPDSGQIRHRVVELVMDEPEWWKVLAELRGDNLDLPPLCEKCEHTGWIVSDDGEEAVPCTCRIKRLAAVHAHKQGRHPLIRSFVEEVGQRQISEGLQGGNDEARLRDKWKSYCDRTRQDAGRMGLPTGGLPALERVARTPPRSMAEVLAGVAGELESKTG